MGQIPGFIELRTLRSAPRNIQRLVGDKGNPDRLVPNQVAVGHSGRVLRLLASVPDLLDLHDVPLSFHQFNDAARFDPSLLVGRVQRSCQSVTLLSARQRVSRRIGTATGSQLINWLCQHFNLPHQSWIPAQIHAFWHAFMDS